MKKISEFSVSIDVTTLSFKNVVAQIKFNDRTSGDAFACGISGSLELLVSRVGEEGQEIFQVDLRPLIEHMASLAKARAGR